MFTLHLQEALDLSAFGTGLVFGVQGSATVVAGVYASKVIGRFGARRTLSTSLLRQGLFIAALLGLGTDSGVWPAAVTIGIPLLGVLATAQDSLFDDVRTVVAVAAGLLVVAAGVVGAGLRRA